MKNLKFGMPTLIELDGIDENVKLCQKLGLSFIELNMNLPIYLPKAIDLDYYKALILKNDLEFTFHLPENMDPFTLNDDLRKTWNDIFIEAVKVAIELDIKVMNMHLDLGIYFTMPNRKIYLYDRYRSIYLRNIKEFGDFVTKLLGGTDIILCIENTGIYDRDFICEGLEGLIENDRIFLTWDIGHDHSANNVDRSFIVEHIDKLKHMHIHDAKGKQNHLAIGRGDIDIEDKLNVAKSCHAMCVLETKTIEGLTESVDALGNILK